MGVQISPSLLSADFADLRRETAGLVGAADWLHVDVMDYHFVPNLTVGLPVVEALRQASDIPLDCHLMIEDPDRWAPAYAEAGAQSVTFHHEAAHDSRSLAAGLRRAGARAGIAIKPNTPFSDVEGLMSDVDMLLVMTVEPGFGGQSFMADPLAKVRQARAHARSHDLQIWIQVDGGVSEKTIEMCAEAGADVFVAGSAVFNADDPAQACLRLRQLADTASAASWWCG
jgi:ribulose-phosphate 3-epimerase